MASRKANGSTLDVLISAYEEELYSPDRLAHAESPEHLESFGNILGYLADKGSRRKNYRHYATRDRVKSILGESAFFLTDGSSWNDSYDKSNFNPHFSGFKRFGICLSATTSESIAMWMLYGGIDGNGAMINFDKKTLDAATSASEYECGYFDKETGFQVISTLDANNIDFKLVDVLYFSGIGADGRFKIERVGDERKASISAEALGSITQIAKHEAWSYESEVRLVASISKLDLGRKASEITAIRMPFPISEKLLNERVFDSPVATSNGEYLDSTLQGTVDWNLCSQCKLKK